MNGTPKPRPGDGAPIHFTGMTESATPLPFPEYQPLFGYTGG
jgi:hypothetical protein